MVFDSYCLILCTIVRMDKMKIDLNKIKEITKGAVRITEENNGVHFYRFTKEQEEMYKEFSDKHLADFYKKSFATAGVKLLFKTNSKTLNLKGHLFSGSSRFYYSIDIFINGIFFDCIKNFDESVLPDNYSAEPFPVDRFSKSFEIGEGDKTVCIYLPWSMCTVLDELSLDDCSFIKPIKTNEKLLVFGDSITQGYDSLYPSNRYACKLAEMIGAEEINKGIGGEMFRPDLAKIKEDFEPDYITVAYGTNDWSSRNKDEFVSNCNNFFDALYENYPKSKIFAISPVWRKDWESNEKFCKFSEIEEYMKKVTENLDNVTVISGFEFVPHEEACYGDLWLHPNDKGFEHYTQNLYEKIKKFL